MSRVIDYTEEKLRENEFSHVCWSNCPAGCQRQLVLELQRQVQSFAPYMTPRSSPTGGVTGILRLPTEVFCMIVQRLAPLHLVALMLTCRSFYDMLDFQMLFRCAPVPNEDTYSREPWFYLDKAVESSSRQFWLIEHGFACPLCFTTFCGSPSSWREDWQRSSTRQKASVPASLILSCEDECPYLRQEDCADIAERRIFHEPSGLFVCPTCIASRIFCDVSILYAQNILRLDQADLQRLKHQKPSFKRRVEGKANRIQFFWIGKLKDVQLARWTEDEAVRQGAYEEKFGRVP